MIVVAGAGIAGLALAGALHRSGLDVRVYEERPAPASTGTGITLWPNALTALATLGVADAVRAIGRPVNAGGIRRSDGRWVRRIDPTELDRALRGTPIVVHRRALIDVLADGVAGTDRLRLDTAVRGFDQRPDRVVVELADDSTVDATALIGADGYRSAVARRLGRITERYAGHTAWRGIADLDRAEHEAFEAWAPGAMFGFLPMREGTYWFAAAKTAAGQTDEPDIRQLFAGWPDPIAAVLDRTPPAAIARHDIYDRSIPRRWAVDRVALIGDAAHPMRPHLGQGGCQALVDAATLAGPLRAGVAPVDAFRSYVAVRRRPAVRCVRQSAFAGRMLLGPRAGLLAARTVAAGAPASLALRALGSVAGAATGAPRVRGTTMADWRS